MKYITITAIKYLFVLFGVFFLIGVTPQYIVHGQISVSDTIGGGGTTSTPAAGGGTTNDPDTMGPGDTSSTRGADFAYLKNPLEGSVDSIPSLVSTILNIALLIAVPLVALAIIYSGFLFIAAQGDPNKLKEAKQTFLYVIIGGALVLGAVIIANAIAGTINQLRA
ncbi:MAG: pilin [Candidatus Pacebacteria bacterium]|nr:pilin [Candidatus Paceibacterota bacterium]MCD8563579.1 pilin [Candidatus Paceibacterota bacterium]